MVQPWGVNPFNLGGFGPGSTGSFDGAEGGDFGGGLGGPFFGPSTMPGFSPGYGMRPYDISNNILYHEMTMGMGLNPFSSNSVLGEQNEDEVESSNEDLEVGGTGVMVVQVISEATVALERATVALERATVALVWATAAMGRATVALE